MYPCQSPKLFLLRYWTFSLSFTETSPWSLFVTHCPLAFFWGRVLQSCPPLEDAALPLLSTQKASGAHTWEQKMELVSYGNKKKHKEWETVHGKWVTWWLWWPFLTWEQTSPWRQLWWKYTLAESSPAFPLCLLSVSDWAAQVCARYLLQPSPPLSSQRSLLLSNSSSWFSRYLTCGLLGNGCRASEPLTPNWPHIQPPNASRNWAATFLPEQWGQHAPQG